MTQINQYPVQATNIKDDDLFDIDKLVSAPSTYESQRVTFGTIKTQLITDGAFKNLGTDDLTQQSPVRTYNALSQLMRWDNVKGKRIRMDISTGGLDIFQIQRIDPVLTPPPVKNTELVNVAYGIQRNMNIYDDGTTHFENGNFWCGDNTLPPATVLGNQMNDGALAIFSSINKPTVFTDLIFPDAPTLNDQSAVAWFRSTSKGVRFPLLTETERNAIPLPDLGLVIFNTSILKMQVYTGIGISGWSNMN